MGNSADGYFPEVLAADLERSSSVFALRHMTSGSPEPGLSSEDKFPTNGHGWPTRFPIMPSYHTALGPARSLGPIKEKAPVVSFIGNRNLQPQQDDMTDSESLAGTEVSKGVGTRSNNSRDRSIFTLATSLTSSWLSKRENSSPREPIGERSWIDADTDDEEPENLSYDNLAALSPRPPTPPESDRGHGTSLTQFVKSPVIMSNQPKQSHKKSHSVSAVTGPSAPLRRSSGRSREVGKSSVSTQSHHHVFDEEEDEAPPPIPQRRRPRASTFQNDHDYTQPPPETYYRSPDQPSEGRFEKPTIVADYASPTISDLGIYDDDDDGGEDKRPKSVFIQPSRPPSPLPTVDSWLNGSAFTYVTHQTDDISRAVPLPPNVVETLRISVSCFPETMLLTSSLTIETIRSYSRKIRQPSEDVQARFANMSFQGSLVPRKSLWRKMASYKKQPSVSTLRQPEFPGTSSGGGHYGQRPQSSEDVVQPTKPWAHFKNIFCGASDYICDALWAHIIAYNYISAHVPRPQSQPKGARSASNDTANDEIPKKAATLLGLGGSHDTHLSPNVQRIANKLAGPLASTLGFTDRQGMMATAEPPDRRTAAQENTMKDIQVGLMRCIARLLATAKLMVEDGRQDGPVLEVDVSQGADVLLARSLCEIVRLSEEEAG